MKKGNIRRIISAITVMTLTMMVISTVMCEEAAWDCPECGQTGNTGKYCGKCAYPAPWMEIENTEKAELAQGDLSELRKNGRIVKFGHYEQDNNTANGPEEIEWIILDTKDENCLLLSLYGLEPQSYNAKYDENSWESCSLRSWLNKDFLNKTFNKDERSSILETTVDNSASQGYAEWNKESRNNTQDYVFLLSYAEVNKYLEDNILKRAAVTEYAYNKGAITDKNFSIDGYPTGQWWLRSSGEGTNYSIMIGSNGSFYNNNVKKDFGFSGPVTCVRPAVWVKQESIISSDKKSD